MPRSCIRAIDFRPGDGSNPCGSYAPSISISCRDLLGRWGRSEVICGNGPQDVGSLGRNDNSETGARAKHVPYGSVHANTAPPAALDRGQGASTPAITPVHLAAARSFMTEGPLSMTGVTRTMGVRNRDKSTLDVNSESVLRGEMTLQKAQVRKRSSIALGPPCAGPQSATTRVTESD